MYIVTVVLRSTSQLLQFNFDNRHEAEEALGKFVEDSMISIDDDYGSSARIDSTEIAGMFLTDIDREFEAQEKRQMSQIQMDIRIKKKLSQDPSARLLMPAMGGQQ